MSIAQRKIKTIDAKKNLSKRSLYFVKSPRILVENYLEFERNADERHEFFDGRVIKMAGESLSHSRICINLTTEIGSQLRRKNCEALSPKMKVRTATESMFSYPDLTIVCGEPKFHDTKKDVLINPTVIFEVLSPSTERYDRGEKFQFYKNETPSLQDYILVSQDQILIERFTKQADETWVYRTYQIGKTLKIESAECEILLEDIYLRVEF
jgi:Uma2 family endonuclease